MLMLKKIYNKIVRSVFGNCGLKPLSDRDKIRHLHENAWYDEWGKIIIFNKGFRMHIVRKKLFLSKSFYVGLATIGAGVYIILHLAEMATGILTIALGVSTITHRDAMAKLDKKQNVI